MITSSITAINPNRIASFAEMVMLQKQRKRTASGMNNEAAFDVASGANTTTSSAMNLITPELMSYISHIEHRSLVQSTSVTEDSFDGQTLRWMESQNREFNAAISQLFALLKDCGQPGDLVPSIPALSIASTLLYGAYGLITGPFPRTHVASDEEGAIYIYWTQTIRKLELTIPPEDTEPVFLYYQEGDAYGSEIDVSPTILAYRLDWSTNSVR
jgi:hypothetical protein